MIDWSLLSGCLMLFIVAPAAIFLLIAFPVHTIALALVVLALSAISS